MESPKLVIDARPIATKLAQQAMREADEQQKVNGHPQGQMGLLIAHLIYQNILISAAVTIAEPGSELGAKWIRETYECSIKDALDRWNKIDLKQHFGSN